MRLCVPAHHQLHVSEGSRRHQEGSCAILGQLEGILHHLHKGNELIGVLLSSRCSPTVDTCAVPGICSDEAQLGERGASKPASAGWHRQRGG